MTFPNNQTLIRQAVAGFIIGAAFSLIGGLAGLGLSKIYNPSGWADIINTLIGATVLYPFGAALGIWRVHVRAGGTHSYNWAWFAAATGLGLVVFLSEPLHLNLIPPLMWALVFIMPVVLAITALGLKKRA